MGFWGFRYALMLMSWFRYVLLPKTPKPRNYTLKILKIINLDKVTICGQRMIQYHLKARRH